jgi:hypothetical protein
MGPAEILNALGNQLQAQLATGLGTADPLLDELQVYQRMIWNPSPPTIDMYPAPEFQEQIGMGRGNNEMFFTVRARVNTPDHEGAQDLLLAMMDPQNNLSVSAAITAAGTASPSKTLDGMVESVAVEGPSDFGVFTDPGGSSLLGCTWRVRVMP